MANPIDPTISSLENTYVNLSGLQAFYDELPSKLVINSARSAGSAAIANDAQNLGGVPATDVINSAHSGQSAYDWVTGNSAKLSAVSALKDIKTFSGVSYGKEILGTLFIETVSADSSASNLNLLENGNIKISGYNKNIYFSAKDTTYSSLNEINSDEYNALTGVSGTTSYFTNGSSKSAINATSSTSAEYASSAEYAPASSHDHDYKINVDSSTVYLSGDVGLKVSGDNVKYFTDGQDIYISAKDTTYTTANFITADHLSNIQKASGYAKNWSDNSGTVIDSANSGAAASAWITAHQNDYLVTSYSSDSNATFAGTANSANYATDAGSASSAETLTNTDIEVASATSAVYSLSAGSASSAEKLTNTAIKVNSSISADYATNAGSATYAEKLTNTAIKVNSAISADYSTKAGSATSAEILTNTAIKVNSAISADYSNEAGSATSASVLTNTAIKVASATSADYSISAGSAVRLEKKRIIAASGDATWSVQFNGAGNVTGNLQINNTPWSSVSSHASIVDSATTNKFTTPKAVYDFVIETVTEKASFIGPKTALDDFQKPYDKTAIYLVGPVGSGTDRYNEYVITGNAGTTADFLLIGDTSTDLSDYQKIADFESWTAARFDGSSAKWAKSATSASKAATLTNTAIKVNSSISADYATNAGTAIYATSAGSAPFISHNHDYKISANTTAFNVSGNIQLSAGTNVGLVSAGTNSIGITAKDTTYTSLSSINSTEYKALTGVSGVKDIKNYSTISAASGSTSKGSFAPSNSASTFTLIAGNNIDFVSGANSLTISSKTYTVNDKTIKITTGANPATGQFSTNTAVDKTITLGSMALAQTSSYSTTSHNHNMTALEGTANFFSGTTAAPSALSALTSKSAISAGSAAKAYSATSALSAGSASQSQNVYWSKADNNTDVDRVIGIGYANAETAWTAGNAFNIPIAYDKELTFNSKTNTLKSQYISAITITATTFSGNLNGSATSALTSKSALSAGSAKNAATAGYANSAGSAPVAPHTISSHSDSANFFSNNSARSACSATSAKNAGTATSAGTAAHINVSQWNADSARYIIFGENGASTTVGYDSDFTYNPSSNKLLVKNISSTNITATTFSGNLSGAASKLTTNTVGSNILPIYLDNGTPTQCKGDIGWKREYSGYKEITFASTDTYENFIDSCSCASSFAYKLFGNTLDTTDKTYNSIGRLNITNAAAIQNGIGISDGYPMFHIVAARQMGYVDFIETTSNKIIRYRFQKDGKLSTKRSLIVSGDSNAPITAASAKAAPFISHDHGYTISAKTTAFNVSAGIQLSAGSNINITSAGTKAIGISARNDIANASDKSTYFDGTSAIYAKSATSATNAAKAADSDKLGGTAAANVIGSAQSGYKAWTALSALSDLKTFKTINAGTTAINADSSADAWTLKVTGVMSMSADTATKTITLSSRDNNSTAYIPSGFQVSGINGSTTGVYYLSGLKLAAGTNIGFTSASNSQITITAKDTTYTTSNFITATHLSNIQTASGYAADWNTNKTNLTNNAKSGWSAYSAVTAHSAEWATNTDTKVSQTVTSDNVFYPILTKDSNGTTTVTAGTRFADVVTVNPSTKMVRANKFGITSSATMEFNSTTNSVDFIFN